jgi:hypothetical protein
MILLHHDAELTFGPSQNRIIKQKQPPVGLLASLYNSCSELAGPLTPTPKRRHLPRYLGAGVLADYRPYIT